MSIDPVEGEEGEVQKDKKMEEEQESRLGD